jgi:small Trp-rich protein
MWLVVIGVLMIAGNLAGVGPTAKWNWEFTGDVWKFALPFVAAAFWWAWADASGLSKRRAMRKDEERKIDRRDRNIDAMGLGHLHKHRDGRKRAKR